MRHGLAVRSAAQAPVMKTTSTWTLAGGRVLELSPFLLAGIINVTPDSFSDGGRHFDRARAVAHGLTLAGEGAGILDVGGESTRPGAEFVSVREELERVVPVLRGLASALAGHRNPPALAVDTTKAPVAAAALDAGALIVNDVSAFRFDPALFDLVVERKPGYVLMHSLGTPKTMQIDPATAYAQPVGDEVLAFFERELARLVRAGLPEDRVVLDPGIGFGKTLEHNLTLMRELPRFAALGRPVYLGISNKSFLGTLTDGLPPDGRTDATALASALCLSRGALIHRVHAVAQVKQALALAHALA